jgi:MerR family transcriptional regulator/heat shock protein HspR
MDMGEMMDRRFPAVKPRRRSSVLVPDFTSGRDRFRPARADKEVGPPSPVRATARQAVQADASNPVACRLSPDPCLDTSRVKYYIRIVAAVSSIMAQEEWFFISMAARELGMHPQTLRKYERLGLVAPTRTIGSVRVYSRTEIARLRRIKHLVDELGINLAGVQRLLSVAEVVERIRPLVCDEELEQGRGRRKLAREIDRLIALLDT